jgi:hypothetical protein
LGYLHSSQEEDFGQTHRGESAAIGNIRNNHLAVDENMKEPYGIYTKFPKNP